MQTAFELKFSVQELKTESGKILSDSVLIIRQLPDRKHIELHTEHSIYFISAKQLISLLEFVIKYQNP